MLTDAQRALVEQYHGVIYAVLSHEHLPASEYYDVGAERLCLAAKSFQGDPDRFFSYAYVAIKHALRSAAKSRPHEADIDGLPIAASDAFVGAEDRVYISDLLRSCVEFMTPAELKAMRRIMLGTASRNPAESGARDRALRKYKKYLDGDTINTYKATLSNRARAERDRQIVELRAHGYGYEDVAERLNVSGRMVRQVYADAGRPQYRTSADFARLYGVDRSTILRHSSAKKEGRIWQIESIKYHKPYLKFSKKYSRDEINFIKNHPYWTAQEISERIGRTANSVRVKKCRMRAPG